MKDVIWGILVLVIEVLCLHSFLEVFLEQRRKNTKVVIFSGFVFILFAYFNYYTNYFVLKMSIIIMLFVLYAFILFEGRFVKYIFLSFMFMCVLIGVEYVLFKILPAKLGGVTSTDEIKYILIIILSRIILFLLILLLNHRWRWKESLHLIRSDEWIRLLYFPAMTIITITTILLYCPEDERTRTILLMVAIMMAVMNFIVFYLIRDIISREERLRKEELFVSESQAKLDYYQNVTESYELQKKEIHEFKNHLLCIAELMKKDNQMDALNYVLDIIGEMRGKVDFIDTNHSIINAVVSAKYRVGGLPV